MNAYRVCNGRDEDPADVHDGIDSGIQALFDESLSLNFFMPEASEGLEVWKNDKDGNDHVVIARPGTLSMRVVKPGGSRWDPDPVSTISTPEEWAVAFAGLGPKWNQDEGSERNEDGHYQAVRRAATPKEVAVWTVSHRRIDATRYEIGDQLEVLLRGMEHSSDASA